MTQQAIEGDRQAIKALLNRYAPQMRRALDGAIPREWQSVLSVDDVLQQAYLHVFLNIRKFRPTGEGSLVAWLSTIARNTLAEALRLLRTQKRGGDRRRLQLDGPDESHALRFDQLAAISTTPSRCAANAEAQSALEQAIEQLPDVSRRVVRLYDIEGHSAEDVAQSIGRSVGAMYMLRARAHDRLAELMGNASDYLSRSP